MKYLSAQDILQIHSMILDETTGTHGVRDNHAILSLENSPKQIAFDQELFPGIFLKAALYARDIIMNHPFIDGNKRTGMTSAAIFLEDNGYSFIAKEGEIEIFALKIVKDKLDLESIALWFEKSSKKEE